jgi:hypothetical protein
MADDDYNWTIVEPGINTSAINITETACRNLEYEIEVSWNGTNATVVSLNGISNAPDGSQYWMMWLWDQILQAWGPIPEEELNGSLEAGDSIAWSFGNETSPAPGPTPEIRYPADVEILFDMGNGTYRWSRAVTDLEKTDSLNVTIRAADAVGWEVNYTLGQHGAFVNAIGGLFNAQDWSRYWMLYVWNMTSEIWEASPVGISSLTLEHGDVIAWYYSAFGEPSPGPTPLMRDPVRAEVLVDYGNGTFHWGDGYWLGEENNGLNMTKSAMMRMGLELEYTVGEYGAFVDSIGGLGNAQDWSRYWMLYVWNMTSGIWEASPVGISSMTLEHGDIIAWYYSAFGEPSPGPTPMMRNPVRAEFLVDYGNGTFHWGDGYWAGEENNGLNMTKSAMMRMGLDLEYTVGEYGAFVDSIGGLGNAQDWSRYWMLYVWNMTSDAWEPSQVGISSLTVRAGDAIAWKYQSWDEPAPHATLTERTPLVVDVLFYMGNGTVGYADGVGTGGTKDAFNLSEDAASRAGIEFEYSVGVYGAYVESIGGVANDMDRGHYWMLYWWNTTGSNWEMSMLGASSMMLEAGMTIAWIYGHYTDPLPAITPDSPYLVTQPPVLSNGSVIYLGNSTYEFSVTVDYNGSGLEVYVIVNGTRHDLSAGTRAGIVLSARIEGISENFTYHFGTNIRPSTESSVPLAGDTAFRDHFNDSAGERVEVVDVLSIGPFLSRDSKPIPSASVTLTGSRTLIAETNDLGNAIFPSPIPPGTYVCTVRLNGTVIVTISNLTVSIDGKVAYGGLDRPVKADKNLSELIGASDSDVDEDENMNPLLIVLAAIVVVSVITLVIYLLTRKKGKKSDEGSEE